MYQDTKGEQAEYVLLICGIFIENAYNASEWHMDHSPRLLPIDTKFFLFVSFNFAIEPNVKIAV